MRERVLTERHVHILIITINRPEAKNAFDLASAQSMHRAMDLDAEDDHFVAVITALPPAVCAAVTAAIRHLKSFAVERGRHQECAARVKSVLYGAGPPVMLTETHLVPVMVGDPEKCKEASDLLLAEYGIYVQPINYPTVPRRTERLRITPSPYHDDTLIDALADAMAEVWGRLGLPPRRHSLSAE